MLRRVMFRSLLIITSPLLLLLSSCQKESQVDKATREGILLVGNANEPKGLDPHIVSGVIEANILRALFEGLITTDPASDSATPGGAALEVTPDATATIWTAKLRPDGKWSDGTPVTAQDFAFAYERMLTPELGAKYAEMLYFMVGAEDFNKDRRGKILFEINEDPTIPAELSKQINFTGDKTADVSSLGEGPTWANISDAAQRKLFVRSNGLDTLPKDALGWIMESPMDRFTWPQGTDEEKAKHVLKRLSDVSGTSLWKAAKTGVEVIDDLTLRITLRGPTPYFREILKHYTWTAVPEHIVLKYGKIGQRGNPWTRPENIVGNGPYKLKSWRRTDHVEVERNPFYWDAKNVTLNGVRFIPVTNTYTEGRMFRNGQLHTTYTATPEVVDLMKKEHPEELRQEPYVGTAFFRFNTQRKPFDDIRVRQALSYATDRQAICDNVFRGYKPAYALTPPMGAYDPPHIASFDKAKAEKLLADAGYPGGKGFPRLKILIASRETAATLAQATQAMWRDALGIEVEIENKEWNAYLVATQEGDYDISYGGWIGDYLDPLTFIEMWTPGNGNNNTGWANADFVKLLQQSYQETDATRRFAQLHQAETLLIDEAPILVIAWQARNYLLHPSVKGWNPLLLSNNPYQYIRLVPGR